MYTFLTGTELELAVIQAAVLLNGVGFDTQRQTKLDFVNHAEEAAVAVAETEVAVVVVETEAAAAVETEAVGAEDNLVVETEVVVVTAGVAVAAVVFVDFVQHTVDAALVCPVELEAAEVAVAAVVDGTDIAVVVVVVVAPLPAVEFAGKIAVAALLVAEVVNCSEGYFSQLLLQQAVQQTDLFEAKVFSVLLPFYALDFFQQLTKYYYLKMDRLF